MYLTALFTPGRGGRGREREVLTRERETETEVPLAAFRTSRRGGWIAIELVVVAAAAITFAP